MYRYRFFVFANYHVSAGIQIQEFPSKTERQVEITRRSRGYGSRMILCILPRAVTRKRNNEGAPLGDAPVARKREREREKERFLITTM
jgi:hypothetical protein